jgi:hypothetical protein
MITDVTRFLDDICVRLGICLEPAARARIGLARFRDEDELEAVILDAEGIDPLTMERRRRHDLREIIAEYWDP